MIIFLLPWQWLQNCVFLIQQTSVLVTAVYTKLEVKMRCTHKGSQSISLCSTHLFVLYETPENILLKGKHKSK